LSARYTSISYRIVVGGSAVYSQPQTPTHGDKEAVLVLT